MENRSDILNELQALSSVLAKIGNANVFSVPKGYFENVSQTVLACLNEESDILNTTDKNITANVPLNYFNDLAENILAKIKSQDAENKLSPVLQNIRNINVFNVPQGYFNNLSTQILTKINTKQSAKVISFNSSLVKYVAAAMFTGAMAFGVYKYTNNTSQPDIITTSTLAKLDAVIEKGKSMDDKQFNATLDSLSTDDIAKYLEKNGDEKDIELFASNIDENNLPKQDDYLADEKTLENYLKEIDTKQTDN